MPRGQSRRSIAEEFHNVMLASTTGTASHPPPSPQGSSPSYRSPSISQHIPTPRASPLKAKGQFKAGTFGSASRPSESGGDAELQEKYSLLQRGFVTLELKYKRRQEELAKLKEESQIRAEGDALHIIELTNQLKIKDQNLEKVSNDVGNVSYATRAVESIVDQVLNELSNQLKCPICTNLLQVPYSLNCFHIACCTCIADSFQRNGAKCPICWHHCTQPPRQDPVVASLLSTTYKLHKKDEPTLASLGLDPGLFVKFFQNGQQPPDGPQPTTQHQHQVLITQAISLTQGHGEPGPSDGNGVVQVHRSEVKGVVGASEAAVAVVEDISMEEGNHTG